MRRAFQRFAAAVMRNGAHYPSLRVCALVGGRLKKVYTASGAFGCDWGTYREALWVIQLRAAELQGQAFDAAAESA